MSHSVIRQTAEFDYELTAGDFDLDAWLARSSARLPGGRGASIRVKLGDTDAVLRGYLRGGAMASLLKDRYLWTGEGSSRPAREAAAIAEARLHGLPVAEVLGYRLELSGLFYRAAIISRFIPNIGTLGGLLQTQALSEGDWVSLGELIRWMHDAGINHADLNANNILIDDLGAFHLIDFDKAKIRQSSGSWQRANLERLKRSLEKLKRLQGGSHFDESQWQALVGGYRG